MTPNPVLISVAPNGARKLKQDHPGVPLTPDELAADARLCRDAGAGMVHLHVRDADGGHSLSPDRYRPAMEAVRAAVGDGMVVQITTEAVGRYSPAEQMDVVRELTPEAASFALRELVPDAAAEPAAKGFFGWVRDAGVIPQFILYTPDEATRLRDLIHRGVIPFALPPVLFVLGRYADGPPSHPAMIQPFLEAWGEAGHWSICAFGPSEIAVATAALALGGHARVGFENNVARLDGGMLESNAEQVSRVALVARGLGRPLARSFDTPVP